MYERHYLMKEEEKKCVCSSLLSAMVAPCE